VNRSSLAGKVTVLALALSCAGCATPTARVAEPDLAPVEGARADAARGGNRPAIPFLHK
jgi:hypothetical protein